MSHDTIRRHPALRIRAIAPGSNRAWTTITSTTGISILRSVRTHAARVAPLLAMSFDNDRAAGFRRAGKAYRDLTITRTSLCTDYRGQACAGRNASNQVRRFSIGTDYRKVAIEHDPNPSRDRGRRRQRVGRDREQGREVWRAMQMRLECDYAIETMAEDFADRALRYRFAHPEDPVLPHIRQVWTNERDMFGARPAKRIRRQDHLDQLGVRIVQRAYDPGLSSRRPRDARQRLAVGKSMQLDRRELGACRMGDLTSKLLAVGECVNLQARFSNPIGVSRGQRIPRRVPDIARSRTGSRRRPTMSTQLCRRRPSRVRGRFDGPASATW